jgi:hypothetical protein
MPSSRGGVAQTDSLAQADTRTDRLHPIVRGSNDVAE